MVREELLRRQADMVMEAVATLECLVEWALELVFQRGLQGRRLRPSPSLVRPSLALAGVLLRLEFVVQLLLGRRLIEPP